MQPLVSARTVCLRRKTHTSTGWWWRIAIRSVCSADESSTAIREQAMLRLLSRHHYAYPAFVGHEGNRGIYMCVYVSMYVCMCMCVCPLTFNNDGDGCTLSFMVMALFLYRHRSSSVLLLHDLRQGLFDLGPAGHQLKQLILNRWRSFFIDRVRATEISSPCVVPRSLFEASGE